MIIDRNIKNYLILDQEPIRNALKKVDANEEGMVVCVDNAGLIIGALTDGDFRRWVISEGKPDLELPVSNIINRDFISAMVTDSHERISTLLNHRVQFVPLTDQSGRCVALA